MAGKLLSLKKRVDKVEQKLAFTTWQEELVNCNCRLRTTAGSAEEFEAEMNLPCPSHGFRRLGDIERHVVVNPDGTEVPDPDLDELIATYFAHVDQADREDEDAA